MRLSIVHWNLKYKKSNKSESKHTTLMLMSWPVITTNGRCFLTHQTSSFSYTKMTKKLIAQRKPYNEPKQRFSRVLFRSEKNCFRHKKFQFFYLKWKIRNNRCHIGCQSETTQIETWDTTTCNPNTLIWINKNKPTLSLLTYSLQPIGWSIALIIK